MLSGEPDTPALSNRVSPVRRVMPGQNKNASFVAAYFLRQHEQRQILPAEWREIRAVDTQFFNSRRTLLGDDRFTRREKKQYLSILTFERLKAHHAIRHPDTHSEQESPDMSSADIRQLIKKTRLPDNSISGTSPEDNAIPPARARFSRIIQHLHAQLSEKHSGDRQRLISASDLYTRRASLSQNVHYLDKKTDRTLFIDTGLAIAVRRNGMTDSAVAVALELAKEKFGSTLTIKGSQVFKDQVISVVAKKGADIHFTDPAMNKELEARRTELARSRDGQHPEPSDRSYVVAGSAQAEKPVKAVAHEGILLEHGPAPYQFRPDMNKPENQRDDSYFVKLQSTDGQIRTLWGVGLQEAVSDLRQGERAKFEDKGVEVVKWTETLKDGATVEKSGQRRLWEGTSPDCEKNRPQEQSVVQQQSDDDYDGPDVA